MGRRWLTQGCGRGGSPRMGQQTHAQKGRGGTARLSSKRLKPDSLPPESSAAHLGGGGAAAAAGGGGGWVRWRLTRG